MTAAQALQTLRTVLGYLALALAAAALAKWGGARLPISGDVQTLALLSIACRMA